MAETIEIPAVGPVKREYVYIAGGVAGVGLLWWIYARRSADAGGVPEDGEPTATEGDYGAGVDAYANPAPSSPSGTTPEVDADDMPPTTNAAWTQRAIGQLSDIGWDPREVAAALGRYLGRQNLASAGEVEIVRAALAAVGPPPQGEFSVKLPAAKTATTKPTTTKPAPRPGPTKPKPKPKPATTGHYVTVARWTAKNPPWNSTLGGIARHYGKSASHVWNLPKNAGLRQRRRSMNRIQPGDRVWVDHK